MQVLRELASVSGGANCYYNQRHLSYYLFRHFTLGKLRSDFPSRVEAYSDRLEYYFKVHWQQHCLLMAASALSWTWHVLKCRMLVA